jgi:hypothetical protein
MHFVVYLLTLLICLSSPRHPLAMLPLRRLRGADDDDDDDDAQARRDAAVAAAEAARVHRLLSLLVHHAHGLVAFAIGGNRLAGEYLLVQAAPRSKTVAFAVAHHINHAPAEQSPMWPTLLSTESQLCYLSAHTSWLQPLAEQVQLGPGVRTELGAVAPNVGAGASGVFTGAFTRVSPADADQERWHFKRGLHRLSRPFPPQLLLARASMHDGLDDGMWGLLRAATVFVSVERVYTRTEAPGSADGVRLAMHLAALNGEPYPHLRNVSPTIWLFASVMTGFTPEIRAFNALVHRLHRGGVGAVATMITFRVLPITTWMHSERARLVLRGYAHPSLL